MALTVGTRLGPYEVQSPLGAGGMGEVYRARDTKLGRDVAIKVLGESFVADPERVARFRREAQILAALNHPHIASIYGLEEGAGGQFLVMELVDGGTLAERIAHAGRVPRPSAVSGRPEQIEGRRGPAEGVGSASQGLPVSEALGIARQVGEALQAAHEKGIVHRDLKPANDQDAQSVTPDGGLPVFRESGAIGTASTRPVDLMLLPLPRSVSSPGPIAPGDGSSPRAQPLIQAAFAERNAEVSPNGQWLAYESNESGRNEVYVRPFPNIDGGRWQVSTLGGRTPLWSRDGQELFYLTPESTLMGVLVERAPPWRSGTPTQVLQGNYFYAAPGNGRTFDIAPDGRRFLMIKARGADEAAPQNLVVVQNWTEEIRRLVPAP